MKLLPVILAALAPFTLSASAPLTDAQPFRLWNDAAPGAQGEAAADIPALTAYLPAAGTATGASVLVFPGGAYGFLSMEREGSTIARWLASNGITGFVVQYRLGPKYHHPVELGDAERAVRIVRANAADWSLDPARVGIIGFSAGGHLASTLSTHFSPGKPDAADPVERVSSRPDLAMLLYPVITMSDEALVHKGSRTNLLGNEPEAALLELLSNEKQVSAQTPPTFIVHSTADRTVPVANSDLYAAGLDKFNVPYVYLRGPYGGHGFGLTDGWNAMAIAWLRVQKFLPAAPGASPSNAVVPATAFGPVPPAPARGAPPPTAAPAPVPAASSTTPAAPSAAPATSSAAATATAPTAPAATVPATPAPAAR